MRRFLIGALFLGGLAFQPVAIAALAPPAAPSESADRIAFAKALFPEDLMLEYSAKEAKAGVRDAFAKRSDLSQFNETHLGFREAFEPAADKLIDDTIRQDPPDLYSKTEALIPSSDPGALHRMTIFLTSTAGKKILQTIWAQDLQSRLQEGKAAPHSVIEAALDASVTDADKMAAVKFAASADWPKFMGIANKTLPALHDWVKAVKPKLEEGLSQLASSEAEKFIKAK